MKHSHVRNVTACRQRLTIGVSPEARRPPTIGPRLRTHPFPLIRSVLRRFDCSRLLAAARTRFFRFDGMLWTSSEDIFASRIQKRERAIARSPRLPLLLEALPTIEGNPYVLPGAKPGEHLKEIKRLWYAVRHAAKLDDVRLHDLRHSYASVPATSGESMLVLRTLLGHKRVATTERYAHLGDDPVKRAANRAGSEIADWLGGKSSK